MVPMGDNFNHSDVTVVQELINTRMHLSNNTENAYYMRSKFMNDVTPLFEHNKLY